MISEVTKPLNGLELLRFKKNPRTERERALLATIQEIEKDYASDIRRWQEQSMQMQMYRADADRKLKAFVQMLSTMAIEKGGPITVKIADLKKIDGFYWEIKDAEKGVLTFELKDGVVLIKKAEEKQ